MTPSLPVKVLLVGCGRWGQNWANTLHALGALAGLCDANKATCDEFASRWLEVPIYTDLRQALKETDAQAVVIATPVPTHFETAKTCLLAGKSVMLEKPMTATAKESETLVNLAQETAQVLAVGHLLMYHPALLKLQHLVRAGELGEIRSVHCTRQNLGTVRNEENVWWSFAPHDLSILQMMLGVEHLACTGAVKQSILGRSELPDAVTATFETERNQAASIHVNWLAPEKRHETVVVGTQKIAVFEDTHPAESKIRLLDFDLKQAGEVIKGLYRGDWQAIPYDAAPPLTLEAQAFLEAVAKGSDRSLPNNGQNGLAVVRMLETVQHKLDAQISEGRIEAGLGVLTL